MSSDSAETNVVPETRAVANGWLRALEMTAPIARSPTRILPAVIDDLADRFVDAPALISDHGSLSYRALADRSHGYARWALRHGLVKGDVVCLLMPNCPEYLAFWLGITRVGGIVSLLNTNIVGASLAHCVDIVAPKHIIVGKELLAAFAGARPHLASTAKVWSHGDGGAEYPDIAREIDGAGAALAGTGYPPVTTADCALCIYTSGTTGLPKAAKVSHHRLMTWSCWFAGMIGTRPSDRMYNCLPMYHSVGGVVATGAVLVNGGSVVIREKFSAREFWDDVVRYDCTLFQYIGELCRYLVNTPPHPSETKHRIRLCCGNGLRPDVWDEFKSRFRIPKILEFYAASEGNVTMFNVEGKPGAIGRIPPFLAHRSPTALVKFDVDTGEPVRDEDGLCIRCAVNETGEAIGKIAEEHSNVGGRFEGYTSKADSECKILRHVFARGDAWFRTGDLMRKDDQGYYYFVDRIGDTFRWKGENVSTSEVSEVITAFPGVAEAAVYGVAVPGHEGRAGMASVVCGGALDLGAFRAHLAARLPAYAWPVFLRVRGAIEITSTFKHRKNDLALEGYGPGADPVYVHDPAQQTFLPLDATRYRRIQSGQMRL
ncbi:MAG: fatty-acyl-CoA synthase [Alphaproteobacteria bacterium]|jgi:fatty-acyl-CoA synthase|nr:fatty-acyl-CoA synthase [Alphaproteobacteria bacterium]